MPKTLLIGLHVLCVFSWMSLSVGAQTLYRYTDKDSKVTYSDKAPQPGEQAEPVNVEKGDRIGNTVKLGTKDSKGVQQQFSDIKARSDTRVADREKLQKEVDEAEDRLTRARKALDMGRDPKEGEQRIVTRPGGNTVIRTEEYYARIESLELAVKKAVEAVAAAQDKYNRNAP
ncbi:hypothetical protein AEM42_03150 [Betaproteobacteria bacterium UKL13-2]|nr:hypothetical protein AEM42_03150 [Betaproteobacteria bacterium UKL13-2]HCG53018.1 hypothetical protein [Betaproteobacteria bacterium]